MESSKTGEGEDVPNSSLPVFVFIIGVALGFVGGFASLSVIVFRKQMTEITITHVPTPPGTGDPHQYLLEFKEAKGNLGDSKVSISTLRGPTIMTEAGQTSSFEIERGNTWLRKLSPDAKRWYEVEFPASPTTGTIKIQMGN